MSLLDNIKAQQAKRQGASELQVVPAGQPEAATPALDDLQDSVPASSSSSLLALNVARDQPTRQLGYRVPVDTIYRFEAYRDRLNALARKKGLKRQSFGDLAELALNLLMEHDPRVLLGVK